MFNTSSRGELRVAAAGGIWFHMTLLAIAVEVSSCLGSILLFSSRNGAKTQHSERHKGEKEFGLDAGCHVPP